ncbi:MAG: FAD-binding protein [Cyclobacteriaceae bacterium]
MNELKKISGVQRQWAEAIVEIGKAALETKGKAESRTDKMLDELYVFEPDDHILFKPTKADNEPFRFNRGETRSYFIGGSIDEDKGFALTPWESVKFHLLSENNVIADGDNIFVMGEYTFTDYDKNSATVEYTFGYRGTDMKIFLHHSSLPFKTPLSLSLQIKEEAKHEQGISGFRVILPGDFRYNESRQISNSYFNYSPSAVAFPRTTSQVSFALRRFREENEKRGMDKAIPLRIMSGGHQHEGMSSANKAFVIRLSELGNIEYNSDMTEAWIPAGMKLGSVYQELAMHGKIIPAGGCLNVNVGGLTQGGGWGMYSRIYGLTCDNILAAEVVMADGVVLYTSAKSHPKLFSAIRGGGGGNFGVVTKFLFKLQDLRPVYYRFSYCWQQNKMEEVMAKWLEIQKNFPDELTSYLRLVAVREGENDFDSNGETIYPVFASGTFTGSSTAFLEFLPMLSVLPQPDKQTYAYKKGENWVNLNSPWDEATQSRIENDFPDKEDKIEKISNALEDMTFGNETQVSLGNISDSANFDDYSDLVGISDSSRSTKLSIINQHTYDIAQSAFLATADYEAQSGFGQTGEAGEPIGHKLPDERSAEKDKEPVHKPYPTVNCDAPHPHKVTSAFSKKTGENDYAKVAARVTNYFDKTVRENEQLNFKYVRCYMTFHAMGGAMSNKELDQVTSFAFRDTEYLIQIQAWWNFPAKSNDSSTNWTTDPEWQQPYVDWVTGFRRELAEDKLVEGAFINFVDKDLGPDYNKESGRYELLKEYYQEKLDELIDAKSTYDPENVFNFPMSIPLTKPKTIS